MSMMPTETFRIGMDALIKLWAIKAVQAVSYLSTAVLFSLVIDDSLNQRYVTDAYDIAVEILEYALENIEIICNEAEIASKTIAEIEKAARQGNRAAKTAKKLLNDKDFNKNSNSTRSKKGK